MTFSYIFIIVYNNLYLFCFYLILCIWITTLSNPPPLFFLMMTMDPTNFKCLIYFILLYCTLLSIIYWVQIHCYSWLFEVLIFFFFNKMMTMDPTWFILFYFLFVLSFESTHSVKLFFSKTMNIDNVLLLWFIYLIFYYYFKFHFCGLIPCYAWLCFESTHMEKLRSFVFVWW